MAFETTPITSESCHARRDDVFRRDLVADRIARLEELPDECLVDDNDGRGAETIGARESAAGREPHPIGGEPVG